MMYYFKLGKHQLIILCFLILLSFCKTLNYYGEDYQQFQVFTSLKKAVKTKEEVFILDLSNRKLDSIPSEVFELKKLKVLNLNYNMIQYIPAKIQNLQQLEFFYVVNNQLTSLPQEIGDLQNLKRLELMKNDLRSLPFSMEKLKNLHRLGIAFNLDLNADDAMMMRVLLPDCVIIYEILL